MFFFPTFIPSASFWVSFTCTRIPLTRRRTVTITPKAALEYMIIAPPVKAPTVAVPAMMKYLSTATATIPTMKPTIAPAVIAELQSPPEPSPTSRSMTMNVLLEKNMNTPSLYSRLARTQPMTPTMSAPIIAKSPMDSNSPFLIAITSPRTAPTPAPPMKPCIARIVRNAQYPK